MHVAASAVKCFSSVSEFSEFSELAHFFLKFSERV